MALGAQLSFEKDTALVVGQASLQMTGYGDWGAAAPNGDYLSIVLRTPGVLGRRDGVHYDPRTHFHGFFRGAHSR